MSMGGLGDSFYEYLLKSWLQSGKTDVEAREMFDDAMKAIFQYMLQTSPNGLIYISDLKYEKTEYKMDELACFAGTCRALSSMCRLLGRRSFVVVYFRRHVRVGFENADERGV